MTSAAPVEKAMTNTRFAHLTDLHLPPPTFPKARELLGKRLLGHLSWRRTRRFRHHLAALEALVADCRRQACDATVVTGDAINIALPSEFAAARKWLNDNLDSSRTLFAPGNHDAYVGVPWAEGIGRFAPFMEGVRYDDLAPRAPADAADFPYVRTVGAIRFIVLNSARPTAPTLASGRLGEAQIARLRRELADAAAAGLCRVVALHHPAEKGLVSRRKGLDDGPALRAAFSELGVELVVHGHAHRPSWGVISTPAGPRPSVGGGSASHGGAFGPYRPARYNIFSVSRDEGDGWRIDVTVRELDPASGAVETKEERRLL